MTEGGNATQITELVILVHSIKKKKQFCSLCIERIHWYEAFIFTTCMQSKN